MSPISDPARCPRPSPAFEFQGRESEEGGGKWDEGRGEVTRKLCESLAPHALHDGRRVVQSPSCKMSHLRKGGDKQLAVREGGGMRCCDTALERGVVQPYVQGGVNALECVCEHGMAV